MAIKKSIKKTGFRDCQNPNVPKHQNTKKKMGALTAKGRCGCVDLCVPDG
jgi:hypothetical protein